MAKAKSKKKKAYSLIRVIVAPCLWVIISVGVWEVRANDKEKQERLSWQEVETRRKGLEKRCPIDELENQDVQLWATILFQENQEKIDTRGQEILKKTAIMQNQCHKRLLLVGHVSTRESVLNHEKMPVAAVLLGMKRAEAVRMILEQQGVPRVMQALLSCGVYFPRYEEKNLEGSKGNQRVDIVLFNAPNNWLISLCLGGTIPMKGK